MHPPWERIKEVFQQAVELQGSERRVYLESACGSDTHLRVEVERLLAHDVSLEGTVTEPAAVEERWVFTSGDSLAGRFEIVLRLGYGAMGQVYAAYDRKLEKLVALKTLKPELANDPRRSHDFRREIRNGQDVSHPNICRIHDLVTDDPERPGLLSFTMELLEGGTLAHFLVRKKRPLTTAEALPLIRQMAKGLAELHSHDIVHRDFKPGNVMLAKTLEGGPLVKITDFGLARPSIPLGPSHTSVSSPGALEGTPRYMAPEQFTTTGKKIGPASDVYAFGTVIYEMVTGKVPYESEDLFDLATQKRDERPKPPSQHVPDLDKRWGETILKCLERDPADRPEDVLEMVDELEAGESLSARRWHPTPRPVPRPIFDNLRAGAAIGAVLIILLALVLYFSRSKPVEAPVDGGRAYEAYTKGMDFLKRFDIAGNLDQAIAAFEEALSCDSEYAAAHAGMAEAYLRQGDEKRDTALFERAKTYAERAVELDSMLAYARVTLGVTCHRTGDSDRAVRELKEAIKLNPLEGDAHRELAKVYQSQGRIEEAEREFEKVEPKDWRLRLARGAFYFETQRYEEAAEDYAAVTEENPNSDRGFRSLGGVYILMGRYAEASEQLQTALTIRPDAPTYSNLGVSLYYQGLFEEAANSYRKAIEAGGNRYIVWGNLGDALHWSARTEEASDAFEKAITLGRRVLAENSSREDVRVRVAVYQAKAASCEDALASLSLVSQAKQSDRTIQARSALVHELCDQRSTALTLLERAIEGGYSISEIEHEPWFVDLRRSDRYRKVIRSRPKEGRSRDE